MGSVEAMEVATAEAMVEAETAEVATVEETAEAKAVVVMEAEVTVEAMAGAVMAVEAMAEAMVAVVRVGAAKEEEREEAVKEAAMVECQTPRQRNSARRAFHTPRDSRKGAHCCQAPPRAAVQNGHARTPPTSRPAGRPDRSQ